ncbi:MAG: hypothetical protein M1816_007882 [Peltula sp. TS41687]|nr:MAG: hypothetical protein M1816_007882 [Peltula sp. TS41687]
MAAEHNSQQAYTQQPYTQPPYMPQPHAQQPQPTHQFQMGGENHGPPQQWQNGFWNCCTPMNTCCLGYWCPCILFGKTQQRLVDPQLQQYETFNANCLIFLGLEYFGLWWVFQMMKRDEFRQRFNLEGSAVGDCCGAYCCPCCGLVQEEKEAIARLGRAGNTVPQQGYQKNDTMGYNPPK